jgi:hypothetical protein
MEAVNSDGKSLSFVSNELKNNYEIVIKAVRKNPIFLNSASDEMKDNFEIVKTAIENNDPRGSFLSFNVLQMASKNLQNNYELILKSLLIPGGEDLNWDFSDNIYINNDDYYLKVHYLKCYTNFIGIYFFFSFNHEFDINLIFHFS